MKPHELKIKTRASRKRVGRGIGSGMGKTAGRGTKGQRSRSGAKISPTFEGGQNALIHRLPKLRGFKSTRREVQLLHTDQLNQLASGNVTATDLLKAGLIANTRQPVRLLNRGPLKPKLVLQIQGASQAATKAVSSAGGRVEVVDVRVSLSLPKSKSAPQPVAKSGGKA